MTLENETCPVGKVTGNPDCLARVEQMRDSARSGANDTKEPRGYSKKFIQKREVILQLFKEADVMSACWEKNCGKCFLHEVFKN